MSLLLKKILLTSFLLLLSWCIPISDKNNNQTNNQSNNEIIETEITTELSNNWIVETKNEYIEQDTTKSKEKIKITKPEKILLDKEYSNNLIWFSIKYNSNWSINDYWSFILFSNKLNSTNINIITENIEENTPDIELYKQNVIINMGTILNEFELLDENIITLWEKKAILLKIKHKIKNNLDTYYVIQSQLFFLWKNKVYILTYTTNSNEEYLKDIFLFKEMYKSFKELF